MAPQRGAEAVDEPPRLKFVDLGAGGGVPSLPILMARPDYQAVMIDASQRRCSFLVWTLGQLGLGDRADVWCGRAEELAHEDRARFQFDAVVSRGFGPPAATVECGAPFLTEGGYLVISEPPQGRDWPAEPLASVGLNEVGPWPGVVTLKRSGRVEPGYPRRAKVQQRAPLF